VSEIRIAEGPDDLDRGRALFREYEEAVDAACCFEGFERELEDLARLSAAPEGALLLAFVGGEAVGCVALRRLSDGCAEMKRLFVRPSARGTGLGGALVVRLLAEARAMGYRAVRLETLPDRMGTALALYRALGAREIAPYVRRPLADAAYLEFELGPGGGASAA
jgi:putative acetyltransferase